MYDHSNVNLPHSFSIHNQDIVKLTCYIKKLKICPSNGLTKYIKLMLQNKKSGKLHNVSG